MTVGVGDGPAAVYAATPEEPREATGWHARFIAAFGGAVVIVSLMLLGSAWSEGLRGSTFSELRSDIASGSVQEWYAADSLSQGDFELMEAHRSTSEEPVGTDGSTGTTTGAGGEPTGGILVWRTWGSTGWQVAASDTELGGFGGMGASANEQSQALVRELRDAGVPMRPSDAWLRAGIDTGLEQVAGLGALLVLAGLVFGAAPRVGTRWFWFWLLVNGPLTVGFIAYAVVELVGIRPRPHRPLNRRLTGVLGFIGAILLSFAVSAGANVLRSWGVPLPL